MTVQGHEVPERAIASARTRMQQPFTVVEIAEILVDAGVPRHVELPSGAFGNYRYATPAYRAAEALVRAAKTAGEITYDRGRRQWIST